MRTGVVVKAAGGFYYVRSETGGTCACVLRGRLRRQGRPVLVGDAVEYTATGAQSGVIETVLPRRSKLVRPPVANVDRAVLVFAVREPHPDPALIDRLLIQAGAAGVSPMLCLNKADLGTEKTAGLISIYRAAGYPVLVTSAKTGAGLDALQEILRAGVSVFAGPSGTGKSSLLNALEPGLALKTQAVSAKIGRGRHTTRHAELLPLTGGGLVVDTPGFSSLVLPPLERAELASFFPEFLADVPDCRFAGCLHAKEPGCAVKRAVKGGKISRLRYESYLKFLDEITEQEKRKYD